MALIVPHASQTGISVANAGRAAEYRSASAFMTPGQSAMPGALRTLAGGIDKFGGALFDAEVARRNEAMELRLLQTAQMYQENMSRADDKYQQEFRGENALDAEEQARERYYSAMNAAMMPWKGNRAAELYLQKHLGSVAVSGVNRMRDYRNQQQDVFFGETVKGQISLAGQMALDPRYSAEEVDAERAKAENLNIQLRMRRGMPAEGAIAENMANRRRDTLARLDLDVANYIQNGDFAGAKAAIDKVLHDPAAWAAKWESRGNPRIIGYDKVGGTSYGAFQIASKPGTMDGFTSWLEKNGRADAAKELRAAGPTNTGGRKGKMPEVWASLVDRGLLDYETQKKFIEETHYQPAMKALSPEVRAAIEKDPGLVKVAYTTSVGHGAKGAVKIIETAYKKSGGGGEALLHAIINERKTRYGSSDEQTRQSVLNRLEGERLTAGLVSRGDVAPFEHKIAVAEADSKAQGYMARIEKGEDAGVVQKEVLALPPNERGPINSQFHAYLSVYRSQQAEAIQDGIIDNRAKISDLPIGEAFKLVEGLPEGTEAERKIKKQAKSDYAYMAAHQGMKRSTDPAAYSALVDKITYGEIGGGEAGIKQLRSDDLAVKVAAADLKKLEDDLKGASSVTDKELKAAFLRAIGGDEGPYAKPLTNPQKKQFLEFSDWARKKAMETNRGNDPDYVGKLALAFLRSGETKRKPSEWGAGYGPNKEMHEALYDPTWLPDLTGTEKAEVDAYFKENPQIAQAWAAVYDGNIEYGKRGFFKAQLETGIGKRRRPPEAAQ